jgi:hypothetical protein
LSVRAQESMRQRSGRAFVRCALFRVAADARALPRRFAPPAPAASSRAWTWCKRRAQRNTHTRPHTHTAPARAGRQRQNRKPALHHMRRADVPACRAAPALGSRSARALSRSPRALRRWTTSSAAAWRRRRVRTRTTEK